ncbi:hypothetical protein [Amycolatopsis vancoresmycina]|uniref:Uncharacterized protein n=1 Tax=Amycolatopsis vancoresmycina DSM 44592 TaxID=1292037 RepID=R1IIN9_9PSEU|nr:hypothetical protein [Amycolatopsis vancoresmycina]EOD70294.1 hypothetical protein H480_01592 [Amycolatopsis vancoresmycina DSM 44592]
MGRGPRFWFPLALLGFAEIGLATAQLLARRSRAESESANLLLGPAVPPGTTEYSRALRMPLDFHTEGTGLPIGPAWLVALGVVVAGTAVWYAVARRPVRMAWFVLGTVGALLAVPLLDLVGSWQFRLGDGLRGPLLATLGLLALAAYERSRFVLLTTAAFALVAVVLSADMAGVLVSASILLAAAFAALLRGRHDTAADTA